MAPTATATLTEDAARLRETIRTKNSEAAAARAEADALVATKKGAGVDITTDQEAFDEVDAAYKVADIAAHEADVARGRLDRIVEIAGAEAADISGLDPEHPVAQATAALAAATLGRRFTSTAEYQDLAKASRGSGRIDSPNIQVASAEETIRFLAATVDGDPFIYPDDTMLYETSPIRAAGIFDLLTVGATTKDVVSWVQMTTRTDAAAGVADNAKAPESTYVYERKTTQTKRLAHMVPIGRDDLDDAPGLETTIKADLLDGLRLFVENQVVAGAGTGENLRGITNTVGIQTRAKGADSVPDSLRKTMTLIRVGAHRAPNGILVNPVDEEVLDLTKAVGSGTYLTGGPAIGPNRDRTLWGQPLVSSSATEAGTAIVGDWTRGRLWVRDGAAISASDNYEDFFARFMVMLMAQMRAAFAVTLPVAFATNTGLNA